MECLTLHFIAKGYILVNNHIYLLCLHNFIFILFTGFAPSPAFWFPSPEADGPAPRFDWPEMVLGPAPLPPLILDTVEYF